MPDTPDITPPAILGRTVSLPDGLRLRLRHARRADADALRALLNGRDIATGELKLARLLSFDPTRRLVLCASTPIDGTERLVGLGAIDLRPDALPDALVVDEQRAAGVGQLLHAALLHRARGRGQRVA